EMNLLVRQEMTSPGVPSRMRPLKNDAGIDPYRIKGVTTLQNYGSRKIKFAISGVEAPGRQGVNTQE
ncbi:MAG: hypothetical protein WAJ95_18265, partial [Desulfobacterales bacterium]